MSTQRSGEDSQGTLPAIRFKKLIAMLPLVASAVLSPIPIRSIAPAFLHDTITINDVACSNITVPSSSAVLFTFPIPYGVLLLDGASFDFYVYTSRWYAPSASRAGFISLGNQRGVVEVVARANVTVTYAAAYLTPSGYPCTEISAGSSGAISISEVMENESLCFVSTCRHGRVHVAGSLGGCAVVNVTADGFDSVPEPPLDLAAPALVIVSADTDCSNMSLSVTYGAAPTDQNFGTLEFHEDLRFGIFNGTDWTEFAEMADDPNLPASRLPTPDFEWQYTSLSSLIVTSAVVFMMVLVLGIIVRIFIHVVRPRNRAASRRNRDFAPPPMPEQLFPDPETELPDLEGSDVPVHSDGQMPDNPYNLGETLHGWI
jgi:hypothetical protein